MDQELIAYLDERFRETSQQIAELREETTRQISGLREETTRQFEQVDRRFEQVDRRFEQVDDRFERAETTARQTLVVIEGLRHEVHIIAEGFIGLHEKLERYHTESTASFDQVRVWIEPYYKLLDNRVNLLDGRLSVLEGRADRQQGDVMEAVRRILGRPPLQPPVPSSD
jgi:chromosome segregation ATPase